MSDRWSHFRRLLAEIDAPDLDTPEGELLAAFPELLDERDTLYERCGDNRSLWRVLLPPGRELKDMDDAAVVQAVSEHVRRLEGELYALRRGETPPAPREPDRGRRRRLRRIAA